MERNKKQRFHYHRKGEAMTKKELYALYQEAQKMPYFSYHQEAAREGVIQEIKDSLFNEFIKEMERKE